jgi:hypothetical protein
LKKVRVRISVPTVKTARLTGWDCVALEYQVRILFFQI